MKSILLTSTALVAFAGAAFADGHAEPGVAFSGDAEFGYNDDFNVGLFWSMGLSVTGTAVLNNGLTATMSGDITIDSSNGTYSGGNVAIDDLVISLASDTASLTFGDTAPAADKLWSGGTNMVMDGFNDEADFTGGGEEGVLIGAMSFGDTEVAISYNFGDTNNTTGTTDDLGQLQLGVAGSAGSFTYTAAYQDDFDAAGSGNGEIFGVSVGMTLGGADVSLAYATRDDATPATSGSSIGIGVSYPVGDAVTVSAFYSMEDNDANSAEDNYGIGVDYASGPLTVGFLFHDGGDEDMQLNVTYDMGNGLSMFGGYRDNGTGDYDVTYIGADYDLGSGASARISYATIGGGTPGNATADELGAAEDVKEGTTLAVSFSF